MELTWKPPDDWCELEEGEVVLKPDVSALYEKESREYFETWIRLGRDFCVWVVSWEDDGSFNDEYNVITAEHYPRCMDFKRTVYFAEDFIGPFQPRGGVDAAIETAKRFAEQHISAVLRELAEHRLRHFSKIFREDMGSVSTFMAERRAAFDAEEKRYMSEIAKLDAAMASDRDME